MTSLTRAARRLTLMALLAIAAGCQDLLVENLIDADRERAAGNPEDVEKFIGGAFNPPLWTALHNQSQETSTWPVQASEFTGTMTGIGTVLWWEEVREPRAAHDNGVSLSIGNGPHGPRNLWANAHEAASIAYDGLRFLDSGMVIEENDIDVTARARAFAKFIQGWSWGLLAMVFDQAHFLPETEAMPDDPNLVVDLALEYLLDYDEGVELAVGALEDAIAIAEANPSVVAFPEYPTSEFWFGSFAAISNEKFIRMAHTLAARILVLSARTPAERANVDWDRVLAHTANGLNAAVGDLDIALASPANRRSILMARFANATNNDRVYRWDYRAIGPTDQSGGYQTWIASALDVRTRFDITTPDRRITGPTPTSHGSYTEYRADDTGFDPLRGLYLYSAYQWRRHQRENGITSQTQSGDRSGVFRRLISADENTLLRAEAFLRNGDAASAVPLINVTRTRSQTIGATTYPGLPDVTEAGVPEIGGECVPRLDSGACGGLFAALRYEQVIETAATDVFRGYAESRGWGTLPDGAPLHWPVPGNALDLYGLGLYTYGGVGTPSTAMYGPTPN